MKRLLLLQSLYRFALLLLAGALPVSLAVAAPAADAPQAALPTVVVRGAGATAGTATLDAVVEPVRQTVLAAQVPGAIVALLVKAGDSVRAGQALVRIDANAAQQGVAASAAQVEAARAQLNVASREHDRSQQLFAKQYISQAAMDQAQAQWEAAQAQFNALQAQARAAQAQSGLHVLVAPYAGVVSEVPVSLGDMVMPGRPLLTLHDPSALRVTVAVPQALLPALSQDLRNVRYEIPGTAAAAPQPALSAQLLPTVDPATHTAQLRLALPAGLQGVAPGMFARVSLPGAAAVVDAQRPQVPVSAIVRRGELTALYVLDAQGQPRLRQVRLGVPQGDQVEVLSGVSVGEQVVTRPSAAAAWRAR